MNIFSWLWGLMFGNESSEVKGEARINERLDDRTDSLQGGATQLQSTQKIFYTQLQKDMKSSKNALKNMRRLKENIAMHYKDLERTATAANSGNPEKTAKHRAEFESAMKKDLKSYLAEYYAFIQTTDNILLKQKYMVGFEDRFLERIFEQLRDDVRRQGGKAQLRVQEVAYLKEAITKLMNDERGKLAEEKNEDSRYYHSHKVKIGFWESFLGEEHFVSKAKGDLKRWNKQEKTDLQLDRAIEDALNRGNIQQALPLIQAHILKVIESSKNLEKVSKDEQTAMEEAKNLSDEVMKRVRASNAVNFLPDMGVVERLELCHSAAAKSLETDLQNADRLSNSLGIMQRNLTNYLDEIISVSTHGQSFDALRAMSQRKMAA